MKKELLSFLVVGGASLALAGGVAVPLAGPRANPEDQARYCWYMSSRYYTNALAAGFNTYIGSLSSTWYTTSPERCRKELDERLMFLDQLEKDGVDGLEQVKIHANKELRERYAQTKMDGSKNASSIDYARTETKEMVRKNAERAAGALKGCPALVGVQTSSEVRDRSFPSWVREYDEACRAALGFPMASNVVQTAPHYSRLADFPVSRVLKADYPLLRYCLWRWKAGDGWNQYQDDVAAIFGEQFGRPLFSMYDPNTRTPPVWGSGGHVSVGGQWCYVNPEPCSPSFVIAEQQAMSRGMPGQKVWTMLQGITYRNRVAPKDGTPPNAPAWTRAFPNAPYITTPPDLLREGYWALLSRQVDGVGVYAWNALFDWPDGDPEKRKGNWYVRTNPESFVVVSNIIANVAVPLGPLFKALPERAPEVALVESYAHCFFAGRTSFGWGYRWGDLGTLANLQPCVLFEEEIARDGIPPTVRVLMMPDCEVLTEATFKAVKAFLAKGGVVAADERLVPGLMPDIQLPTNLLTQYDRSFHGDRDNVELKKGVRELRAKLDWVYRPHADTNDGDIFAHVRTYRDADYVFAINDRRTYGDYVGPWKMMTEKGLPNEGTVTLRRPAGAVYDLVRHVPVRFSVRDGVTEIPVSYETNDGHLFLAVSRPLGKLTVKVEGKSVAVLSDDRDVMIPIEVRGVGKKPFYGVMVDGVWRHDFAEIGKVSVRNLATDSVATVPADLCGIIPDMNDLTEKTINCERKYTGKIVSVDLLDIELPDGRKAKREVVRHGNAVAILARRPDGKFVFVKQYRKAAEEALVEVIAGGLEPGEDPIEGAKRETAEETGYDVTSIRFLTTIICTPGYCEERIHLYFAELSETAHGQDQDPDENVHPVILSEAEVEDGIRNGTIFDAKTLAAWTCYKIAD